MAKDKLYSVSVMVQTPLNRLKESKLDEVKLRISKYVNEVVRDTGISFSIQFPSRGDSYVVARVAFDDINLAIKLRDKFYARNYFNDHCFGPVTLVEPRGAA